ncbi:hypothetical protein [Streptomyces sp. NPDC050988]|uniref:hypothetical protein n=1 Tax=Streptomyces sp. NPDC050988 TaxID=3365637 RepID=UPI0037A722B7
MPAFRARESEILAPGVQHLAASGLPGRRLDQGEEPPPQGHVDCCGGGGGGGGVTVKSEEPLKQKPDA